MAQTAKDLVAAAKKTIKEVTLEEGQAMIQSSLVLDVREPAEYAAGALPKAVNIPRGVLEFKIGDHPRFKGQQDEAILLYCKTGGRAALATEALIKLGFSKVVSLAGGFDAWQESGGEVVN